MRVAPSNPHPPRRPRPPAAAPPGPQHASSGGGGGGGEAGQGCAVLSRAETCGNGVVAERCLSPQRTPRRGGRHARARPASHLLLWSCARAVNEHFVPGCPTRPFPLTLSRYTDGVLFFAKVVVGWQGSGDDCSEAEEEESIYSEEERVGRPEAAEDQQLIYGG
jgi:hypothetical protein